MFKKKLLPILNSFDNTTTAVVRRTKLAISGGTIHIGGGLFQVNLNVLPYGNMDLAGYNTSNIDINVIPNGTLSISGIQSGEAICNLEHLLYATAGLSFRGASVLENIYELDTKPSLQIIGRTTNDVEFILSGDGLLEVLATQGSASLDTIVSMFAEGNLTLGAGSNLDLSIDLQSLLTGIVTGKALLTNIYGLFGDTTTGLSPLYTYLFNLQIQRNKSFVLPIETTKSFILNIKDNLLKKL